MLFLAKGLLWACAAHQLTLYDGDAVLDGTFRHVTAELIKGPRGWANYSVCINLGELGWRFPPVPVRSLSLQLQFAFVIRMASHPFLQRYDAIVDAVFNDDAPLAPFLGGWARNGAYACLSRTIQQAVAHNFVSLTSDKRIQISSRLREIQLSRRTFQKIIASWIRTPGEPLAYSSQIVWSWLVGRMAKIWGPEWNSHRRVGRVREYLVRVSRVCPPREHNALVRMVTGGVSLWNPLDEVYERQCLLVKGCGGENSLEHYARSRCWHDRSLLVRHCISLSLLDILTTQPTTVRARAAANLAYMLVKAINFVRTTPVERRPANAVLHCARYR